MSEDVGVPAHDAGRPLTWTDVVGDSRVGLVDLDGHGTTALMNDAARELLQLLREGVAGHDGEGSAAAAVTAEAPRPALLRDRRARGPLSVRGDLTELLATYAPAMAETIRREGRGPQRSSSGPAGPLGPSRVVSCPSSRGRRLVRIDGYRRSGNRFLVTLVDVTSVERDPAPEVGSAGTSEAAIGWELADTLAQRLVTAETALDLGRDEFGRRLVAEARALVQTRIGEHVRRSGGLAPGVVRRQGGPDDVSTMDER
ncbi:hypothetical protein [Nocardioides marmoribigeumensis]|uniref:Uncharacterized protein n=1 Tax=Nocardioides marmoribigeumensis TaxID=433649 RepID=A0ABU2BPH3_9ACTN|nr:hypothetical protein [Nocardioides marmoribigeumensis]MDR7360522.1 hypothetical protein [Nocardioides marmoribigeumensis]